MAVRQAGSRGCDCALTHHNVWLVWGVDVISNVFSCMHKELFSIKRLVDLLIQFDVALKTIKIIVVILNAYWSHNNTKRRWMWIKRQNNSWKGGNNKAPLTSFGQAWKIRFTLLFTFIHIHCMMCIYTSAPYMYATQSHEEHWSLKPHSYFTSICLSMIMILCD